jgi:hypothetical protein
MMSIRSSMGAIGGYGGLHLWTSGGSTRWDVSYCAGLLRLQENRASWSYGTCGETESQGSHVAVLVVVVSLASQLWLCGEGRKGRKEGREEERWVAIDTPVLQSIDRYQTLFCMEAAAPIDCGSPMP